MTNQLLSLKEIAEQLRLPVAWIKREAKAGRLPSIRAGRHRLFDLEAVLRTLATNYSEGVRDED